jgi:hypothetical protein
MSMEENKAAVRRLLEAFNAQDEAAFDTIATAEVAQHNPKTPCIRSTRCTRGITLT